MVSNASRHEFVIPPALRHEGSRYAARDLLFVFAVRMSTQPSHLINGFSQGTALAVPQRPQKKSGVLTPEVGMIFGHGIYEIGR